MLLEYISKQSGTFLDECYLIDIDLSPSQLEAIRNLRTFLKEIFENKAFYNEDDLRRLAKCLKVARTF